MTGSRSGSLVVLLAVLAMASLLLRLSSAPAEAAQAVPAPALDPQDQASSEVAVLAGG